MDTNNEAKQINEEELEQVSGGTTIEGDGPSYTQDSNCYFEPAWSDEFKSNGPGQYRAKCKSTCLAILVGKICRCHGTARCVDRWHMIELTQGGVWRPWPSGDYNHSEPRKAL